MAEKEQEQVEQKRKEDEQEREEVKQTMEKLEEDPPKDLKDWPSDKAKYETFGGGDGTGGSYEDGVEAKLGPSGLRHHEDGSVSIDGEQVDNPDDYKGEPIPGGPTDPDSPMDGPEGRKKEYQERKAENIKKAEQERGGEDGGEGGDGGGDGRTGDGEAQSDD
jgi:hypothetical protein